MNELLAVAIRLGEPMKKLFGGAILLSVFGGIFAAMAFDRGFLVAAGIWAVALWLTAIIVLGVWLLVDG